MNVKIFFLLLVVFVVIDATLAKKGGGGGGKCKGKKKALCAQLATCRAKVEELEKKIEELETAGPKPGSHKSCKEAYDAGEREDKAYELDLEDGKTKVYCHMSPIAGCGSGGFSLVMRLHGTANTFKYDSALWTNHETYNAAAGASLLGSGETKLPTYWETPVSKICLGMNVGATTNYLSIHQEADSLYSLIADNQYRHTSLGRDAWKGLIAGSSLQVNCNKEGFNAVGGGSKVRIGISSNQENDCNSNDSRIGFGGRLGGVGGPNSCGNVAYWFPDNGDKNIRATGLILVQ